MEMKDSTPIDGRQNAQYPDSHLRQIHFRRLPTDRRPKTPNALVKL
jgi:hypothetical protein